MVYFENIVICELLTLLLKIENLNLLWLLPFPLLFIHIYEGVSFSLCGMKMDYGRFDNRAYVYDFFLYNAYY
jgi:hypothetical protein